MPAWHGGTLAFSEGRTLDSDSRQLLQHMIDVQSSLRSLHETIEMRQAQSAQMQEAMRSELHVLRQDHRELEERLHCVVYVMRHDVGALRSSTADNSKAIDSLAHAVDTLRRPIAEIVLLKSRIAGLIIGVGFIGSAVLWLAEPVYRWLLESKVLRSLSGS